MVQQDRGKGDIVWGSDPTFPYFSVFWKNGQFDHIRLYLRESMRDASWGRLQEGEGVAQKFRVETLQVES